MAGIDRKTGEPIDNFSSALQGVETILGTPLYTRIMLRQFGGAIPELLGKLITSRLFLIFKQLIAVAIDTWEPRFRVRRIYTRGTVDEVRKGQIGINIEVDYRPNGHLKPPDFTVESVENITVLFKKHSVKVRAERAA